MNVFLVSLIEKN